MSEKAIKPGFRTRKLVLAGLMLAGALLLPASALADPTPIPPPAIPGAPALPGPVADAATASPNMTILSSSLDQGVPGTSVMFSAKGLAANKAVDLVWMTSKISYILDPKPDSVDYIGRKVDKLGVVIAKGTTDGSGNLSIPVTVPLDFGGLHDVYVVAGGVQLAKGGFLVTRTVTISPTSGPIGTPITIKVVGMGAPTYESVGAVLYDNHYVGAAAANTTRGVVSFVIRASGDTGTHWIEYAGSSHTVPYLNMKQSPVPWTDGHRLAFTVTKDAGRPANRIDWPVSVTPTVSQVTTLSGTGLPTANVAGVNVTASSSSGPILTKVNISATGLTPGPVSLQWASVVGNRVNCLSTCWSFVYLPLGNATAGADGSLKTTITVPDNLGGWHAIQLLQTGKIMGQVPYFVKRSLVDIPKTVKTGTAFTIHLKGVGWTQLDNTLAVTYDNAYIGYACGFNSNGDVQIQLFATGKPGTHIIDLYPLLYTQSPAYPYAQLGMVPFLSYATEFPGLALGYQLPAFRLAITVTK